MVQEGADAASGAGRCRSRRTVLTAKYPRSAPGSDGDSAGAPTRGDLDLVIAGHRGSDGTDDGVDFGTAPLPRRFANCASSGIACWLPPRKEPGLILNNALLLALLVLAVAAGWTLGRGGLRMDGLSARNCRPSTIGASIFCWTVKRRMRSTPSLRHWPSTRRRWIPTLHWAACYASEARLTGRSGFIRTC